MLVPRFPDLPEEAATELEAKHGYEEKRNGCRLKIKRGKGVEGIAWLRISVRGLAME